MTHKFHVASVNYVFSLRSLSYSFDVSFCPSFSVINVMIYMCDKISFYWQRLVVAIIFVAFYALCLFLCMYFESYFVIHSEIW